MHAEKFGRVLRLALLAGACLVATSATATAQLQIENKDGSMTLRIGFLAQPQLELLETADGEHTSTNLFIRRFRVLFGGKVANKWLYFFETDSPNLGRTNPDATANPSGAKEAGDVYIQDMFLTYDHSAAVKVDMGMILFPFSHNHGQSAASLLPVDYGTFTFVESAPMGERVGRDYGFQLRGYPAKQKLEYRLGVFQGVRGVEARNGLRVAGRGVYYPYGADTGFFYGGTWQGTRKMLGVGGSFDVQKDYKSGGADLIYERPLAGGRQGVTLQVDWTRFDGGDFITALPKQDALLVEAGYHLGGGRYTPFVQYSDRNFDSASAADQKTYQVGLAWWLKGHSRNIKASVGEQRTDGKPNRLQALVQLQVFSY
jgi:hypothetical protein